MNNLIIPVLLGCVTIIALGVTAIVPIIVIAAYRDLIKGNK